MKTRWLAALIAPVLWLPFMGWTQDKYPSRAINVVSPFPPGGISDLTAVLGGHAVSWASPPALAAPHIKSGKVRAFAQWAGKRLADFPDVPMFKAWWDKDAEKLADVVKRIGKLEAK